eukprot:m.352877 g.352877  ORF g.352877 m.352877 type:complete len:390 (-) comp20714_c0_seq1:525-1694(-)
MSLAHAERVEGLSAVVTLATPLQTVQLQQHQQNVLCLGAQPEVVSKLCLREEHVFHGRVCREDACADVVERRVQVLQAQCQRHKHGHGPVLGGGDRSKYLVVVYGAGGRGVANAVVRGFDNRGSHRLDRSGVRCVSTGVGVVIAPTAATARCCTRRRYCFERCGRLEVDRLDPKVGHVEVAVVARVVGEGCADVPEARGADGAGGLPECVEYGAVGALLGRTRVSGVVTVVGFSGGAWCPWGRCGSVARGPSRPLRVLMVEHRECCRREAKVHQRRHAHVIRVRRVAQERVQLCRRWRHWRHCVRHCGFVCAFIEQDGGGTHVAVGVLVLVVCGDCIYWIDLARGSMHRGIGVCTERIVASKHGVVIVNRLRRIKLICERNIFVFINKI